MRAAWYEYQGDPSHSLVVGEIADAHAALEAGAGGRVVIEITGAPTARS